MKFRESTKGNMSLPDIEAVRAALKSLLNASPDPLSRAEFDALSPKKQSAFCLAGGKLTNGPTPAKPLPKIPAPLPPMTASRDSFDKLSAESQSELVAMGYEIVDDRDLQND